MAVPPFINVGKVRMTLQAFIILMCGVVVALSTVAAALFMRKPLMLIYSAIVLGAFMFISYTVNCTVVGKCTTLSWIFVGFYIFYTVVMLASGAFLMSVAKMIRR
jgi:hypothetical protein